MSLLTRTRSGLVWSTAERLFEHSLGFMFGIVLARLLEPEDFGIVAMPMVFFSIAQCFVDCGFTSALIRKKDVNDNDLSTAFFFNVILGIICFAGMIAASGAIARFYNKPILSDLLKVSSFVLLLNPLSMVQQAILTRNLEFKKQAKILIAGKITIGLSGIAMAYMGLGVWSLVFQQVAGSTYSAIIYWYIRPWHPNWCWSWQSFRYLIGYGGNLLLSNLLDILYNNVYTVVIGKFHSAASLAFFTSANRYASLPATSITSIVGKVTFPVLSKIQDDDQLGINYRRMLNYAAFVVFPLMTMFSALARPVVNILVGEKWEPCVPLLQIICFSMMLYPLHSINLNLLKVKGKTSLFLRLEIAKKVVWTIIIALTITHSMLWMVIGCLAFSWIALIINTYYTGKLIGYGYVRQMKDFLPIIVASGLMWAIIQTLNTIMPNDFLRVLSGGIVGILVYYACARCFLRSQLTDTIKLMPERIKAKISWLVP